ncbi:MAG: hypothetical protein K0Q95_648 [Bacteroidota bacterium]|jgi:hypothetical protein|nr:hypothetical protein [Bacteroidota bacterium]
MVFFAGFVSCKRDPSPVPDLGFNYFPDAVGTYVIYDVDSSSYDNYPVIKTTTKYQLKEKIESIFTDNEGRPTIRLERYIKKYNPLVAYSAMSWQLRNVWTENKTLKNVEKVEDNVRYIKLIFPVSTEESWNGNAKNTSPEEEYKYGFHDLPGEIGNIQFDSVLQVMQYDVASLVHKTYAEEKYARNAGLVYKRFIDVDSQPPSYWYSPQIPFLDDSLTAFYRKDILDRITSGYQYTMTVNSYGKE